MALPRIVLVKEWTDNDGEKYLGAGRNLQEIAPDDIDHVETVGTYRLMEKRRIVKIVREVPKKPRRGRGRG